MSIYAGKWRGVIAGQDANGPPMAEPNCRNCQSKAIRVKDQFTPWMQTGHAEIFTQQPEHEHPLRARAASRATRSGIDPDVDNGGVDKANDYDGVPRRRSDQQPRRQLDRRCSTRYPGSASSPTSSARTATVRSTAPDISAPAHAGHRPHEPLVGHLRDVPRRAAASRSLPAVAAQRTRQLRGRHRREPGGAAARCHTANGFLAWLPVLRRRGRANQRQRRRHLDRGRGASPDVRRPVTIRTPSAPPRATTPTPRCGSAATRRRSSRASPPTAWDAARSA